MWNRKYETNEPVYKTETDSQTFTRTDLWLPEGEESWVGWEVGVSRYKLLYVERINKFLLYSTENYIQYTMINYNGKGYFKRKVCVCVCVCITESLCYAAEINTTL